MNDFLLRMKSLLGDEFDDFLKFYNSDDFIKGLRVNNQNKNEQNSQNKNQNNNQNKNQQNSQNKSQNNCR